MILARAAALYLLAGALYVARYRKEMRIDQTTGVWESSACVHRLNETPCERCYLAWIAARLIGTALEWLLWPWGLWLMVQR